MIIKEAAIRVGLVMTLTFASTLSGKFAGAVFAEEITAASVQKSINRGVEFLRNTQNRDGKWDGQGTYNSGQTALATLALLNCGLPPDDPTISKALKFIRSTPPTMVYEISLQVMVFCAAEPKVDLARIRQNIQMLVDLQQGNGGWGYSQAIGFHTDPSNSQFAVLALWEAQRIGIEVPVETLERAQNYWLSLQRRDGGWDYHSDGTSGSMTCAGIASLLITDDALRSSDARVRGDKIDCCGMDGGLNRIDMGVEWLSRNFSVKVNPPQKSYWLYYMYALERVGRLTGLRNIGEHDWYREGSEEILSKQDVIQGFFADGDDQVTSASFALLFLSKGKRQVVINRLRYGESDWNLHRRSIVHLTGHIEQVWKRDLSWQTVAIESSRIEDLLEAPVLFISGSKKLKFTANEKQLLKDYVDQGGFIFAEACNGDGCDGAAFDKSFRELVEEIFGLPLKKLPITHPVWFAESKLDPSTMPEDFWLYGIDACCRTSIVYSPMSLTCRWELSRPYGIPLKVPQKVQTDLDNAVKIGLNVVAYATGRDLKDKLDRVEVLEPIAESGLFERGMLILPKLQHSGGSDDVPRVIPNLMQRFNKETQSDVSRNIVIVPVVDSELEKYPLVYIHGRASFQFSDEERVSLRKYFENGGFLLGDAICASQPFAESLRKELGEIFPEASLQAVPPDHPMLTQEFNGYDIQKVTIVDPIGDAEAGIQLQRREGPPVLEMLVWKDRPIAIFSPYDLSCALESRGSLQCKGYPQEDATRIAINLILYAMLQ